MAKQRSREARSKLLKKFGVGKAGTTDFEDPYYPPPVPPPEPPDPEGVRRTSKSAKKKR